MWYQFGTPLSAGDLVGSSLECLLCTSRILASDAGLLPKVKVDGKEPRISEVLFVHSQLQGMQ